MKRKAFELRSSAFLVPDDREVFMAFCKEAEIPYIQAVGGYTGKDGRFVAENSFIIPESALDAVEEAGLFADQESIMYTGADCHAYLEYVKSADADTVDLGYLMADDLNCLELEPMPDAYTIWNNVIYCTE